MATRLSQRSVEEAACPPGQKDRLIFDSDLPGFGLRVTSAGRKSFLAQYSIGATKRRVALGAFGVVTVEQARRQARVVLGAVAAGNDPFMERKAAAEAARVAKAEAAYTFGTMIEAWAAARAGDRRESYLREAVACTRRNLSKWWDRPASAITTTEAVRALDTVKASKGTVAANRTLAYGRAAYSWAVRRQAVAANPLRGIERAGREQARERVLSLAEAGAIWRAAEAGGSTSGAFVRVLLASLQRRGEVAEMRWDELSPDLTTWTLPGARAKNGRAHVVHLAEPVRAVLADLPRVKGEAFVFPSGRGAAPVNRFATIKDEITAKVAEAGVDLGDWRFHDFRRAGVTALAGMGFAPHVCDRILNHITGAIHGVAAVYQRHEFLTERRAALDAWVAAVVAVAGGKTAADNVVQLRETAA